MMATLEIVNDSNWYPDSGATNPCTPYSNNLMSNDAYHGQEQLYMGDGSSVTLQNIGQCIFLLNLIPLTPYFKASTSCSLSH